MITQSVHSCVSFLKIWTLPGAESHFSKNPPRVFRESDNLPSLDLSCLLQTKPNVRTSKTKLNNTFLYGQTRRERSLTNFIYLFWGLGRKLRALHCLHPWGTPSATITVFACSTENIAYTHTNMAMHQPLPTVEIKRGIWPGAWSWQFWRKSLARPSMIWV